MLRKRTLFPLSALALCVIGVLASTTLAQIPRPQIYPRHPELRHYLRTARFTNTVVVDPGGRGDFSQLGQALAYVATQNRSQAKRWLVLLYPGQQPGATLFFNLVETRLTIPSWTSVQGMVSTVPQFSNTVTVGLSGTSGDLLTMGEGASISKVSFFTTSPMTGPAVLLKVPNGAGTIHVESSAFVIGGTSGDAFPLDVVSVQGNALLYLRDTYLQKFGPATQSRLAVASDTAQLAIYGGRYFPGTNQQKCFESLNSATVRLWWSRVDAGCTTDLVNTGGGTFSTFSSRYATQSGPIDEQVARYESLALNNTCQILTGPGAPEGAVTAPVCSLYLRTNGGASTTFCVKESGSGATGWACK
jgi:hypothetical protein